jgi:retron-type reverse transcriptase
MLEAGYIEKWTYHETYSGTAQGNILSPLLSNIMLNELDKYIETELIPQYTKGSSKQRNPEYNRLNVAMSSAKKKKHIEEYRQLRKQKQKIPSQVTDDPTFRRLKYVRYADDFLLGFIGSRKEAMEIKKKISEFLRKLKLSLSDEKTLITDAGRGRAEFLGYEIHVTHNDKQFTKNHHRENTEEGHQ